MNALKWKTLVPDDQIKVVVSKGWITFEGDVDWQYQKDAAFDAVHFLVGVQGSDQPDHLKPHASATEVKSRIEAAFRRSAELDAQNGPSGDPRWQGHAAWHGPLLVRSGRRPSERPGRHRALRRLRTSSRLLP